MIDMATLLTKTVLVLLLTSSIVAAGGDYQIAKPGCQDECGGVKIPFPFGIGDGCYNNQQQSLYEVTCSKINNSTKPVLLIGAFGKKAVLSIGIEDHSIRISSKVAYQCYNGIGESLPSNNTYELVDLYGLNISATKNLLVGIGCDTTATAFDSEGRGMRDTVGCVASCSSLEQAVDGRCPGIRGCCATSIFNTMEVPNITAGSMSNYTRFEDSRTICSAAFLTEAVNGSYDFSVADLRNSPADYEQMLVPVVFNWYILYLNCSGAKIDNNGRNYLCGSNTRCLDESLVNWDRYRCQCLEGYAGSPYLSNGCQGLSISLGSILVIVFVGGLCMLLKRGKEIRERENNFERNGGKLLEKQLLTSDSGIGGNKIFSKAELEKATDNFNDNRVLGRGGQGTVYKGMLSDGTIVAIKKSKKVDENQDQSIDQFVNEVVIMSKINHRNVVKLFGCCLETKVPLLVYEYVPNGTLDQHIHNHNSTEDFRITWKMRFQIAVDCAGALAYLHSSSDTPTYHRDIKSSNILLDEKYRAKVSDFGISKNISIDQTHVTTAIQGTYGYLDPEYYQLGQFTDKSDVYSFGVVLLELLTSKRPLSTNKAFESQSLVAMFLQLMADAPDEMYHILDIDVLQECSQDDRETLVKLTRRCLNMQGKERPTMKEVAMTLEMIKVRDDQALASASLAAQSMKKPDGYEWLTDQIEKTMGDGSEFPSLTPPDRPFLPHSTYSCAYDQRSDNIFF